MPPGLSSSGASMSVPTSEASSSLANTSFGPIHPHRMALLPSPPIAAAVAASASAGRDYYSRGRGRGYWRGRGGWGHGGGRYGRISWCRSSRTWHWKRWTQCMGTACSISHVSGMVHCMFTDTV